MPFITRQGKSTRLTIQELDGTLNYLFTSSLQPSGSGDVIFIDNLDNFPLTGSNQTLYFDESGSALYQYNFSSSNYVSLGSNLFSTNLTLSANRTHDLNGNSVTFLKSNFEFRAVDALSNTIGFRYRNLANTQNIFSIKNQGRVEINGSDALVLLTGTSYTAYWLNTPTAQMSMFNEGANYVGFRQNTNDLLFQRGGGSASETHTSISVSNGSWNFGLNWASATAMLNVGMGTLNQARLGVQAINGNSGERVLGLRNHTNTGWLAEFRNDGKFQQNGSTLTGDFSVRSRTNTATDIGMYLEQNGSRGVWYNDYNGNQWQRGFLTVNTDNSISHEIIQFGFKDNPVAGAGYSLGIVGSAWAASSNGDIVMRAGRLNAVGLQKFIIRNSADQDRFIYDNETASLQLSAINGNSGGRVLGLRNHTNTGWLAEFRNDGTVYFGGNIYVPNISGMYLASNSGTPSSIRTSFGALFIEAFSSIGIFAENKPLIASINNYPALVYSAISLETPDVTLWNGSLSFYVDEVNNDIKIKVKKSDGTVFTKTI